MSAELVLRNKAIQLLRLNRAGLVISLNSLLDSAEYASTPEYFSPSFQQSLKALMDRHLLEVVAVISDRPALECRKLIELPDLIYLGQHGLEVLRPGWNKAEIAAGASVYRAKMKRALEEVKTILAAYQSQSLEQLGEEDWQKKLIYNDKGISATIDYHHCFNPHIVRHIILQQSREIARQNGLYVNAVQKVIEFLPAAIEFNRGTTVVELYQKQNLTSLIYLGSDEPDLEAFKMLHYLEQLSYQNSSGSEENQNGLKSKLPYFRGLAIGVMNPQTTPALAVNSHYLLNGAQGVAQFLSQLASDV
jgi:trehalose 6-phosphate phosphatase